MIGWTAGCQKCLRINEFQVAAPQVSDSARSIDATLGADLGYRLTRRRAVDGICRATCADVLECRGRVLHHSGGQGAALRKNSRRRAFRTVIVV